MTVTLDRVTRSVDGIANIRDVSLTRKPFTQIQVSKAPPN